MPPGTKFFDWQFGGDPERQAPKPEKPPEKLGRTQSRDGSEKAPQAGRRDEHAGADDEEPTRDISGRTSGSDVEDDSGGSPSEVSEPEKLDDQTDDDGTRRLDSVEPEHGAGPARSLWPRPSLPAFRPTPSVLLRKT